MGFCHGAAGAVVYGCADLGGDVLDECAAAPDVQRLRALADGEDGLVKIEGVLDEELVDGGAVGVGVFALGDSRFAVFLGIDVGGAAGEEDAMAGGEDLGNALRGLMERDGNGCGSGGVEGVEVLRQAALVVGGGFGDVARAGRFGYGDVDGHDFPSRGIIATPTTNDLSFATQAGKATGESGTGKSKE